MPVNLTTANSVAIIEKPEDFTWRSWAVFLLHTGAEVEHALLIQYLYAAYSIRPGTGGAQDPSAIRSSWRRTLIGIAREEMGHLLTVQNILHVLRAPLNLEREDFPFRSRLYPFPFKLEPATRVSLAKYILAEMPPEGVSEDVLPADERERITRLAALDGGEGVNQVGLVYDTLRHALQQLPSEAFHADGNGDGAGEYQSGASDWQDRTDEDPTTLLGVKTIRVNDQPSAVAAVDVIAQQGEGALDGNLHNSHFLRLLNLFREFPPENSGDSPTFPVPTNPNTSFPPDVTTITHPVSRRWAALFNLRYAALLAALQHALQTPVSDDRELLIGWVFEEMSDSIGAMGDLFAKLASLDLDEFTGRRAAGPFELPYSMVVPTRLLDWWRWHLDIIDSSRQLIELLSASDSDPLLEGILDRDGRTTSDGRREIIAARLASE